MSLAKAWVILVAVCSLMRCTDEALIPNSDIQTASELNYSSDNTILSDDCSSCAYVVPPGVTIVDGAALGLKPGDVIGLDAGTQYHSLHFKNIIGTLDNPIIIRNCGGVVTIDGTGNGYSIKTSKSAYFRITGGDVKNFYGIVVRSGHMGVQLGGLSTHFEVDHLEIGNSGFAGIMAKTDPGCDEATWRGNFIMKGVSLHHTYIHDTGGEGIYAGNSFFMGMNTPCGVKLPHEIHYIRIFGNIVRNSGWEAIQLGCATKGASIHANVIENYGLANVKVQNNGIQIGTGTGGLCYNNLIKRGMGNGIIVLGLGDNVVYNNVIDHAGNFGIFCDERYTTGSGFKFINNTILSPKSDGIRLYADNVAMNVIVNNIVSNPGSYYTYAYPRTPDDAFIYLLNDRVKLHASNNYFSVDESVTQLLNAAGSDYSLAGEVPVIDRGADISAYHIRTDFNYKPRLKGLGYDIGAVEHN